MCVGNKQFRTSIDLSHHQDLLMCLYKIHYIVPLYNGTFPKMPRDIFMLHPVMSELKGLDAFDLVEIKPLKPFLKVT